MIIITEFKRRIPYIIAKLKVWIWQKPLDGANEKKGRIVMSRASVFIMVINIICLSSDTPVSRWWKTQKKACS